MKSRTVDSRSAVSLLGAVIIGGLILTAGAIAVSCLVKWANKAVNGGGPVMGTNAAPQSIQIDSVQLSSGERVTIESLKVNADEIRVMVQRWFPDKPEEFMYIADRVRFETDGIIDWSPNPTQGFYHIYLITP